MTYTNFAIVVLNWNGIDLLKKFLPTVIEHSNDASVYVIDNASTDNSVNWLQQNHKEVSIIQLKENLGYAGGYQKGLKQIDAEFYCLLNSDIEVTENWLQPIKKLFISNNEIAAIQPKILDYKKPTHFEYAGAGGGFIDKYGYPFCRGRIFDAIEEDKGQYNDEIPIFWASGACFFIRSKDYWKVSGLDTDYFAHQEEIDLCWRLHNFNKKVYYTGKSTVLHVGGASLDYQSPKKTFLNFRNSLFSIVKNTKGFQVLWIVFVRMVLDGIAGIQFLAKGQPKNFVAILKAHFSFYANLNSIAKKRKTIPKQPLNYSVKSIVFNYFIKKQKVWIK